MALDTVAALKALGDENRLRVVRMLGERGELCACKLLDELDVTQPTLSHHMKVLQSAGLVSCRRHGRWCSYALDASAMTTLATLFSDLSQGSLGDETACGA